MTLKVISALRKLFKAIILKMLHESPTNPFKMMEVISEQRIILLYSTRNTVQGYLRARTYTIYMYIYK